METQRKSEDKPSLMRRGLRLIARLTVTTAILAGAAFAVQFGTAELTRRADSAPSPDAAPAIPVQSYALEFADAYTVERAFIGQIEAQKTVSLSFELPGRLSDILVDEGDTVTRGQVLARQDTALLEAERTQLLASKAATEAQLTLAIQTLERNQALNERGFATQAGLDDAMARRDELTARMGEIAASLQNVDIRVGKAQITAPFDGRVTLRSVDGGETLGAGQSILGLVELGASIVRVGVPLDLDQARLKEARIDVAGRDFPAKLMTLRPDIDPVTRTRIALFEVDGQAQSTFGQTARLRITQEVAARGLWLPLTSLKEGVRGQWTVLAVDPDSIVRAAPVEILHATSDRVFVRGAFPAGTRLIEEGPQRVTVGQRVASAVN